MLFDDFIFERLSSQPNNLSFDCNDDDLNDFFINNSFPHQEELLAVTYYFKIKNSTNNKVAAYFSVLNDSIRANKDSSINKDIPEAKRHRSVPAVKIGRLAIDKDFQKKGIGSEILAFIKYWFVANNKTGCKFLLADAYNKPEIIEFYKKNGFEFLTQRDETRETRQMAYNLRPFAARMKKSKLI